jgi:hypothetical protein
MSTAPPARGRRGVLHVVVGVAVLVAVYAAAVALFAVQQGAQVRVSGSTGFDDPVIVDLEPRAVDAAGRSIEILFAPEPGTGEVDSGDGYSFDSDAALLVAPSNGERQIDYAAGRIVGATAVEIPFDDGAVEAWPFDRYRVSLGVAMAEVGPVDSQLVPTDFRASGSVPGWVVEIATQTYEGRAGELPTLEVSAGRPAATVVFAVVLLVLMIALPVLVLTVAISAYRGRRKVEATLMSWMGAMLFATIPLRNFFPGAPPIGSWVDYLVVLWVIAGLIIGLGVFVAAWLRWTPSPGSPARW